MSTLNYCMVDMSSPNNICKKSDDTISKYSEEVKSINDVVPCNGNNPGVPSSTPTPNWNCNDRGSCNMGDGSYQKWLNQTSLRRS